MELLWWIFYQKTSFLIHEKLDSMFFKLDWCNSDYQYIVIQVKVLSLVLYFSRLMWVGLIYILNFCVIVVPMINSWSLDKQQHLGKIAGTCDLWKIFLCVYIPTSKSLNTKLADFSCRLAFFILLSIPYSTYDLSLQHC